jgi:hypothetical protein
MSAVNSDSVRAGASGVTAGYVIEQSCRFNDDDSAHMHKTPGSAGDTKKCSISFWMKRGNTGSQMSLISSQTGTATNTDQMNLMAGDTLRTRGDNGNDWHLVTTQVFRDPTAWMHIVMAIDTAQATAANRIKIYVNGVQVTSFSTETYPTQDLVLTGYNTTQKHYIGTNDDANLYFDGYLAEVYYIDGTQYAATDFGETDDNGNWVPKDASDLTFGTNGYHLKFEDSSNLGNDSNGGTDLTESGLAANDKRKDSPTDDADNDIGNYAVMLPITPADCELRNGNLTNQGDHGDEAFGTNIAWDPTSSDGFYAELHIDSNVMGSNGSSFGIVDVASADYQNGEGSPGSGTNIYWALASQGTMNDASGSETLPTAVSALSISDYYQIAVKSSKVWFGVNDTWANSGDPAAGSNAAFSAVNTCDLVSLFIVAGGGSNRHVVTLRTDPTDFEGTIPSGFNPVCTAHLPAPAIKDPSAHFNAVIYTGNGSARDITFSGNSTLTADYIVIKNRDQGDQFKVLDRIRGVTKEMNWDDHIAESTDANGLDDFSVTDGFGLGSGAGGYNDNTEDFVAYGWAAGGTTGSVNGDGDTDITLSVNSTAGFSYGVATSPSSGGFTVGHGLGVQPSFVIQKNTNADNGWNCWHKDLTNKTSYWINLYNNDAEDSSTVIWNNTAPTTSVMSANADWYSASRIGLWMFFAQVEGYSSFGSYTGNNDTDGPVIYTGFKPAFVMMKRINSTGNWVIFDNKRSPINPRALQLHPNLTNADGPGNDQDFLSNGWKVKATGSDVNASSGIYIYAAFAENPFGGSGVAQARAG